MFCKFLGPLRYEGFYISHSKLNYQEIKEAQKSHQSFDCHSKVSCKHCNFKANSEIELESHNIIKHKPELSAIAIDRYEHPNESLELSLYYS